MISHRISILCFVFLTTNFFFSDRHSYSQSTIIKVPGQQSNHVLVAQGNLLPNSSSKIQTNWESILLQPCGKLDEGTRTVEQLLKKLESFGLPVNLDLTATDDSIGPETEIETPWPLLPLIQRLNTALEKHNGVLIMRGERLDIISIDVVSDPEFFHMLTYDVSRLNVSTISLASLIRNIVSPDEWMDTNGESGLVFENVNGHQLMTLTATYGMHLQTRRLLLDLMRLSGNGQQLAIRKTNWQSANSRVIDLPRALDLHLQKRRRTRSRGVGGLGGGGGVF